MFKQSTFQDILNSEWAMVQSAPKRYGALFDNALQANSFLASAVKSIDADRFIFAGFLALIRKHHMLAILSVVRFHHVQAMMNLRQVLEAGACAAYAIQHTDADDFADTNVDGTLELPQKLVVKRYKWLAEKYPAGSDAIKRMKDHLNASASHANIVSTTLTLKYDKIDRTFPTTFFDEEDDFVVKSGLWNTANIGLGLVDLLYEVNRSVEAVKFVDDFGMQFRTFMSQNEHLKNEMMASETFKNIEARRTGV